MFAWSVGINVIFLIFTLIFNCNLSSFFVFKVIFVFDRYRDREHNRLIEKRVKDVLIFVLVFLQRFLDFDWLRFENELKKTTKKQ